MGNTPQILPSQGFWLDRRLSTIYHNEFAYKAEPPQTIEEWKQRKEFTKAQVALSAGLSPMPAKTKLQPKIWGHTKHAGTVIAKVSFESMPGLVVTGNLYMPERVRDQAPGILCPHGHWQTGRIHNDARGSIPMRCLMLARLGFIVFSYDMIGYNDNNSIMHSWPEEIRRPAALYGTSMYGLQTWNSLRALDFLCDLPDVDERRIGCTGASGGGSQTWTVSVLDERIKVIVPVCMLSSHFQGGCQCEEGPLLRLNGVTSFDILAACAPRPLMLPAVTQDWTNLTPRYEIKALRKVYALFNAEDALKSFQLEAPHNYNKDTRERVYPWFTHWLLNQSLRETITEDDIPMPAISTLLHTQPPVIPTENTTKISLAKINAHLCENATPNIKTLPDAAAFRQERVNLVGEIVNNDQELRDVVVRVTAPSWELTNAKAKGCLISRREMGDVIPAVQVVPYEADTNMPACLLLGNSGKSDFFKGGNFTTILDLLVANKTHCLVPDLLGNGETADMPEKTPRDEAHPLFFAFNQSIFSMRVQDILTCLKLLEESGFSKISLIATGDSVKPALCALALTKQIHSAVIDFEHQTDSDEEWLQFLNYQPMIAKVGKIKGIAPLANVATLGLYKPEDELAEYITSFSDTLHTPQKVSIGRDTFLRLIDYVVCKG